MSTLQQDIHRLVDFIAGHPRLVVLTGAGISAESGIPTYRDRAGAWLHRAPVQEQAFVQDAATRRRYWARSWYGWPTIRDALPNPAHRALAHLEQQGHIELLITQNVDRLHQRAGSRKVVDLHGRVDRVRCLACAGGYSRDSIQQLMGSQNAWPRAIAQTTRPDGDMDVADDLLAQMVLPRCQGCAGDLKPDVVFFGGSVSAAKVTGCVEALAQADALLVVGSSLVVYSGFRFCRRASQLGKPIGIINPGVTRADDLAQARFHAEASPLLTAAVEKLYPGAMSPPYAPDSPS